MSKLDQLSVITDEISQDFEHSLDVASKFGLKTVDLRTIWNKNITFFTDDELESLKRALDERKMRVGVITGPLGKCMLPISKYAKKNENLMRNPDYNLGFFDRIFEISDFFQTPHIRIFTFLRLGVKSQDEGWNKMIELLTPWIEKAEKQNKVLHVENDLGMQVGSIEQTKRFFNEINSKNVKLLLDPGNFFMEKDRTTPEAYQDFYDQGIIGHMHIKDPKHKLPVAATFTVVGEGKIDYPSLLKQAIDHDFNGYFILETHSIRNKEEVSKRSLKNLANWLKEYD